ncbi:Surface polysaccharide O-acyltransferase, integral membrane enzyme [Thalassovita taeanensis]|uniref:Surface polysaccharide O-acyltransferase, integral membrane enzyme n=2 Tax=Thalassovita taeanensis TaxID=657014 RepID=A0A1H8YW22_9RHOB|nr:Surface polysaccharide O-acyltransferase, integral membrane enzyme [Thalassovita taeanensis]
MPSQAIPRTKKRQSLELLRFLAMIFIVMGHLGGTGAQLGNTALSLFILLSVALSGASVARHGFRRFAISRLQRILVPWLIWCGIYLALFTLLDGPAATFRLTNPLSLLIGPALHLWFLPFMLLVSPLIYVIALVPRTIAAQAALWIICSITACVALYLYLTAELPQPLIQWSSVFPTLLYGLLRGRGTPIYYASFLVFICAIGVGMGAELPIVYLTLAVILFEVFMGLHINATWPSRLGSTAFGIYLVHPAFIVFFTHFIPYESNKKLLTGLVFVTSWIAVDLYYQVTARLSR